MNAEFWPAVRQIAAWAVAGAWCVRVSGAIRGLPTVADLSNVEWDVAPEAMPSLTVVVPGRDEGERIAATLDALMQADYGNVQVLAVDDRSGDATGTIMDDYARRFPEKLRVLHVTELPEGWLGKTHAMQMAVEASESEYVLFTDADILFAPSVLRRAVAYAESESADHLVVMPTLIIDGWGEGAVLGVFQMMAMWGSRFWKVRDPAARRDFIGVGAFNFVRRDALERIGGLEPQRLAVVEDMTLGVRMKSAGMRQRVAFAPGMVRVHWAFGPLGIVRVLTKNLFAVFGFKTLFALGACAGVALLFLAPFLELTSPRTVAPALLVFLCVSAAYKMYGPTSGVARKYAWAYPLGTVLFCYAILRSVVVTWKDGGVRWRGTLYPLRELREQNDLRRWMKGGQDKLLVSQEGERP